MQSDMSIPGECSLKPPEERYFKAAIIIMIIITKLYSKFKGIFCFLVCKFTVSVHSLIMFSETEPYQFKSQIFPSGDGRDQKQS